MRSHLLKFPLLLFLGGLCGCQSLKHPNAKPATEPANSETRGHDLRTRDNALALLDDLLNDEKNLSKILIIKRNSEELGRLIENISKTAGEGADLLESLAKKDAHLNLKQTDLPPGEITTRKAISKTKEQVLLHSKDDEFEFQLLLTQVEALNYGAHLAQVAAENEPQAERTRDFLRLSSQLSDLREKVVGRLRKER
jgi:hypothetical protein